MSAPRRINGSVHVAIVDDEELVLKTVSATLRSGGFDTITCLDDARNLEALLRENEIGVLLLDLSMPNVSGGELLDMVNAEYPELITIVITGNAEIDTAVRCMKSGAFDYLVKPFERSKLIATVRRGVEIQELRQENNTLRTRLFANELNSPGVFNDIVSVSDKMKAVFLYVEAVAPTRQPVLITGETGVGKELVARAVHTASGRAGKLVAVNVAGFDDNMLSDTLFGHQKGSFTGATTVRRGLVETAADGTLFLDEIGDLSAVSQVKLLRLLDSGEFFPIGSDIPKRSEARIIVATNRDLEEAVSTGDFRRDLYYRLYTHHIHIPPLRERVEDIPLLLRHFLQNACDELNVKVPRVSPDLAALLSTSCLPGNVRELKSMVFDAVTRLKSSGRAPNTLPVTVFQQSGSKGAMSTIPETGGNEGTDRKETIAFGGSLPTIKEATELLVEEAMKRSNGKQTVASQMLGISQQALSKRLKADGQDKE